MRCLSWSVAPKPSTQYRARPGPLRARPRTHEPPRVVRESPRSCGPPARTRNPTGRRPLQHHVPTQVNLGRELGKANRCLFRDVARRDPEPALLGRQDMKLLRQHVRPACRRLHNVDLRARLQNADRPRLLAPLRADRDVLRRGREPRRILKHELRRTVDRIRSAGGLQRRGAGVRPGGRSSSCNALRACRAPMRAGAATYRQNRELLLEFRRRALVRSRRAWNNLV